MNNSEKERVRIFAIVAMDDKRVIGYKNELPWRIPEDLKRFSTLTTGHAVLMGRKTYQSLPDKFRPLPGRLNMVITRDPSNLDVPPGVLVFQAPIECIKACQHGDIALPSDKLWIIGGAEIYRETQAFWDEVFITRVKGDYQGDTFLPEFESGFELVEREEFDSFIFERCIRRKE